VEKELKLPKKEERIQDMFEYLPLTLFAFSNGLKSLVWKTDFMLILKAHDHYYEEA